MTFISPVIPSGPQPSLKRRCGTIARWANAGFGSLLLAPLCLSPGMAQSPAPRPNLATPDRAPCLGATPVPEDYKSDLIALRSLLQRHQIAMPELARLGNPALSRYEFAISLNLALDVLQQRLNGQTLTLSAADLATVQRLQTRYAQELAVLRGRVDALMPRANAGSVRRPGINQQILGNPALLNQFSTTTTLRGEAVFSISPQNRANPPRLSPAPPPNPVGKTSGQAAPRPQPSAVPIFQDELRRERPGTGNTEGYNPITENPFQVPKHAPLSTFSIDVDTASYSNVRRFITQGQLPPKDAVRLEELINYFPYDYPLPTNDRPFSVTTEMAPAPWNPAHKLVQIGLKGKQLATLQPSNLVFLIDVSGSMQAANKLPLVKQSLCLLVQELSPHDQVTLVAYAGQAGLVLPATSGRDKAKIMTAIEQLEAGGSTAGGQGIELAYAMAQKHQMPQGNNRVILATDGDFNVGVSSDAELVRLIEQKRDRGIFLTVLGFGMGNYKDSKMEQLANKGNGNYAYIDSFMEAKKVLVNDLRGTLFTIAKDVKIQVEFNPAKVQAYRLIGYENRLLRDQDFNDDAKDAGEIGAGHTVTALYEIIPTGVNSTIKLPSVDPLNYQLVTPVAAATDEWMQVKLRYKAPTGSTSQLMRHSVRDRSTSLESASANLKFSAAVAMYGMLLRQTEHQGRASFEQVLQLATAATGQDRFGYRREFISLVEQSRVLMRSQATRPAPKTAAE
jgi:Ca-activated chloride channel homolog